MDTARWPQLAAAFSAFRRPVVIIDLEATGGNPYTDRITEIAFLRFDGNGVSSYRQLVNPQRNIPEFVSNLTGIDDEMVADAPPFADLSDDLLHRLRGTLLLAHNSKFDYTFLRHEFPAAGFLTPRPHSAPSSFRGGSIRSFSNTIWTASSNAIRLPSARATVP